MPIDFKSPTAADKALMEFLGVLHRGSVKGAVESMVRVIAMVYESLPNTRRGILGALVELTDRTDEIDGGMGAAGSDAPPS